jgi:hypothetical protein
MAARQSYDDSTKAAVMAALLAGQAVSAVAKEYNIPPATIRTWKSAAKLGQAVGQEQRYEIGDMLLSYLREILNALRLQAIQFGKEDWLHTQNAADLAVLHGVATDKAIRIIEALAGDSKDSGQGDGGGAEAAG